MFNVLKYQIFLQDTIDEDEFEKAIPKFLRTKRLDLLSFSIEFPFFNFGVYLFYL